MGFLLHMAPSMAFDAISLGGRISRRSGAESVRRVVTSSSRFSTCWVAAIIDLGSLSSRSKARRLPRDATTKVASNRPLLVHGSTSASSFELCHFGLKACWCVVYKIVDENIGESLSSEKK